MHGSRRRILPIIIVLAIVGAGIYFFADVGARRQPDSVGDDRGNRGEPRLRDWWPHRPGQRAGRR